MEIRHFNSLDLIMKSLRAFGEETQIYNVWMNVRIREGSHIGKMTSNWALKGGLEFK